MTSYSPKLFSGAVLLYLLFNCACSRQDDRDSTATSAQLPAAPTAKTPDRLPPGELMEGPEKIFGFAVPKGMKRTGSVKLARISGTADFEALVAYVKARVLVRHAELQNNKLVFPNARILGNNTGIYELTIVNGKHERILTIEDHTPPPAIEGLSNQEVWNQAGLTPEGKLVDPHGME